MSRLESLVVNSAARLGMDEVMLLFVAIIVVMVGTGELLLGVGLVR